MSDLAKAFFMCAIFSTIGIPLLILVVGWVGYGLANIFVFFRSVGLLP